MTRKTPHVLIILDGWGHRDQTDANAIHLARTPVWDEIWQNRPHCLISASGSDVGLPEGQMGNSEVGHMNLGAGRVIDQDFTRISKTITDGSFFRNPVLREAAESVAASGNALHLFGLLSEGGVHSHEDHIKAAVKLAFDAGVPRVYVHAFLDGRDVPPQSARKSLLTMQSDIAAMAADSNSDGAIASIVGRYYAMDRDNRWDRVAKAYNLVTSGNADFAFESPVDALDKAYDRGETDEFVEPTAIKVNGEAVRINDGDAVVFMNFRADRAREITRAFTDDDFDKFNRETRPRLSTFVTLTEYATDIHADCAFSKLKIDNSLGEYLSDIGKSQLRLAETEKYAHVTFFFSGGREAVFEGEIRQLIPSPDVATYDLQPSMSAIEVTDKLVDAISSKDFDFVLCNFANGDMVGHTGNLDASIEAVECIDECLNRIESAIQSVDGHCLITADHGNVELMHDKSTGQPHTAHTSDLVPLVYLGNKPLILEQSGGYLCDISPTLLALMDLEQPAEMTGKSLIVCANP